MDRIEVIDYAIYAWRCTLCPEWGECETDVEAKAEVVQHMRDNHQPHVEVEASDDQNLREHGEYTDRKLEALRRGR